MVELLNSDSSPQLSFHIL